MTIEQEVWKEVKGYEGLYKVSSLGRFMSLPKTYYTAYGNRSKRETAQMIMKPYSTGRYLCVDFRKDGDEKTFKAHRVVAEHFIPNPLSKPQVNHINGDKMDNRAINLEWVTASENVIHSYRNNLQKIKTGIEHHRSVLLLDTAVGVYYESISEAALSIGCGVPTLWRKLKGSRRNNTNLIIV